MENVTPTCNKCVCFDPAAQHQWSDRQDIGFADDWDVSRMRCTQCGTPWLRAFIEFESFSRSGRHYRAPTTDMVLRGITAQDALRLIEESEFRIFGGSRFDGRDHVNHGPGALFDAP